MYVVHSIFVHSDSDLHFIEHEAFDAQVFGAKFIRYESIKPLDKTSRIILFTHPNEVICLPFHILHKMINCNTGHKSEMTFLSANKQNYSDFFI